MRCGACAKPVPITRGSGHAGRQRKCCPNERCERIYYGGHQRTKCQRCGDSLPRGRAYQRLAVCMQCAVEIVDIIGLERLSNAA